MAKIVFHEEIEIDKCDKCPKHYTTPYYTEDPFEHASNYFCGVNNKKIDGYVEWRSELCEVPDWCPCRKVEESGEI